MDNYSANEGSEQPPLPHGGTAEWDPLRHADTRLVDQPRKRIPGWSHTTIRSNKTHDFLQVRVDVRGKVYAVLLGNKWPESADTVGYFTARDIIDLHKALGEIVADIYRHSPPSVRIRYKDLCPELREKFRAEACRDEEAERRFLRLLDEDQ